MGSGRVNSPVGGTPGAYCGVHDDAYVQPVLVGRLTAAVLTYALDGRRFGGRSRFSLLAHRGAAARGGGHDQEVEKR
ncbi:hypothetical protein SUDANB108_04008 [Streptomyces sp. enrichment culture]